MGLTDSSRRGLLDEWHSEALVSECLEQLLRLLIGAENIRDLTNRGTYDHRS